MSACPDLPNSPVAETARKILEKSSELGYPPQHWLLSDAERNVGKDGAFSSLWKQLTGQVETFANAGLPFSWDPDELSKRSSEFLAIHKTVILKQLGPRQATAAEIDLFGWFWKSLVEAYARRVSELPNPDAFSEFASLTYPIGKAAPDERQNAIKFAAELNVDPEVAEGVNAAWTIGDCSNFYSDFERWGGWGKRLGFTKSFCFPSGVVEGGLDADVVVDVIGDNDPLKLRLLFWWGWPDAPFMCMQRMISEHTDHLVEEGYLRQKTKATTGSAATFVLTDSGLARLKELDPDGKIGLLNCIKLTDLVSLGANLSSLCQFLFPK